MSLSPLYNPLQHIIVLLEMTIAYSVIFYSVFKTFHTSCSYSTNDEKSSASLPDWKALLLLNLTTSADSQTAAFLQI